MKIENTYIGYIHKPLSRDLHKYQKVIAVIVSFVFLIFAGLAHLCAWYLDNKKITQLKSLHEKKHSSFEKVKKTQDIYLEKAPKSKLAPLRERFGKVVQEHFIDTHYSQNFPPRDQITVPHPRNPKDSVKWSSLSWQEKVHLHNKYAHNHGKLYCLSPFVDLFVAPPWNSATYLQNDPRRSHGNDHAVRASLFAANFAYLYMKYHPDCTLTEEDLIVIQLVAAGHDMARQNDGTDLFDEMSAEEVRKVFRDLGVEDEDLLEKCYQAVAGKDIEPNQEKSWIAKCVQNADSADFARLLLSGPVQDKKGFAGSKNYLDIFTELKSLGSLKQGLTFDDFSQELDALRVEMNEYINLTTDKESRKKCSAEGKQVYDEMLKLVTPTQFPLFSHMLSHLGVILPPKKLEEERWKKDVDSLFLLCQNRVGFGLLKKREYEELLNRLTPPTGVLPTKRSEMLIEVLQSGWKRQQAFSKSKSLKTYGALLPSQKDEVTTKFDRKVRGIENNHTRSALARIEHEALKKRFSNGELTLEELDSCAERLVSMYYGITDKSLQDPTMLSTATLMWKKGAFHYLEIDKKAKASKLLQRAAAIYPEESYIETLFPSDEPSDEVFALLSGAATLRHHRLRVSQVIMDKTPHIELSFELPSKVRKDLTPFLENAETNSSVEKVESVPGAYVEKKDGVTTSDAAKTQIGTDLVYTFKSGVEVRVGNCHHLKNQHNFVRVLLKKETPLSEAHKALSLLGLPSALLPPRREDFALNTLNLALNLLQPQKVFSTNPRLPAHQVLQELNPKERNQVKAFQNSTTYKAFGGRSIEVICPRAATVAKEQGLEKVGTFLLGIATDRVSDVVASILNKGFLSSQERYQRGTVSFGYSPITNFYAGSANQVFTRAITRAHLERQTQFSDFPLSGNVFFIINPQVFERMPYFYYDDCNGWRKSDYGMFAREKNKEFKRLIRGGEILKRRPSMGNFFENFKENPELSHEVMFNHTIDPSYIDGLQVDTKEDYIVLRQGLERAGIRHINGKPLDEAIILSETL